MNDELILRLNTAMAWLSRYPQDFGELVDQIAMARQEVRKALELAQKEEKQNGR